MKLNFLIENRTKWLLWTIFGASILSKIFIIPLLGAAWFPYSDEHLQIELAKSIFYHHNAISAVFDYIKQFSEILYPLVISPMYAFYSPENILTILRTFGLIVMSSAVFPAYKLGHAVLHNKKQALLVSIFAILIPEMALAFSVVQEVIYYPLFLFTIYLIYKKICGEKVSSIYLGFILFLLWSCKAVGATVLAGYILYLFCELIFIDKFKHYKTNIVQILIVVVMVFGLKALLSLVIRYANYGSFATVSDFWTITALHRVSAALGNLISDFPNGVLYYLFFTSMIFMVFPLILPFDNLDQYEPNNQRFLLFLSLSFLITITTVVVLIYMDEGGAARDVQRIHYRYLFMYFIPFLVMMIELDFSRVKFKLFGIIYASFIVIYFFLFQPKFTEGSIIDAKSLLLVEKFQKRIINGSNIIFLFVVLISIFLCYIIYKQNNRVNSKKILVWVFSIVLFINQGYAFYNTYQYYTTGTKGIARKTEYSSLSKLVNSKPGIPILIDTNIGPWIDVLYTTQSNKDLIKIYPSKNPLEYVYDTSIEPNFLIMPKNKYPLYKIQNMELVDTDLQRFNVYQLINISTGVIKFDYMLLNRYHDNWLMDNAKIIIAGHEGKNQIYVSLILGTNVLAGNIEAILTDSTGNISSIKVNSNGTSVSLLVFKKTDEQNFELSLDSKGYFIPTKVGLGADERKLTYYVTGVEVK